MSAVSFEIVVSGVIDGVTPMVFPSTLPDPVDGVYTLNVVNVGVIDPVAGNPTFNLNTDWAIRAFHVQTSNATRALRSTIVLPGVAIASPIATDVGTPPLMLMARTTAIVPRGSSIVILTDDTSGAFTGAPAPGPHRIYLELEPVLNDQELSCALGMLQEPQPAAPLISARQYGVYPNTGADMAVQLQYALDQISALAGTQGVYAKLQLEPGLYLLGTTITQRANTIVCGAGRVQTVLRQTGGATPLWRFVSGASAISRTELAYLTIEGQGQSNPNDPTLRTGTGISLTSAEFVHIHDVNVWDFAIGIDLNDGSGAPNFSAYNKVGPVMEVNRCTTGLRAYANANGNLIEDTRVFFSHDLVDGGIGLDVDNAAALAVRNCHLEACDTCFRVRNSGGFPANQELQVEISSGYIEPGVNPFTANAGALYDVVIVESQANQSDDVAQLRCFGNRYNGARGRATIPPEGLHWFDGYNHEFFGARVDGGGGPKHNMVRNGQVLYFNTANVPGWALTGAPTLAADTVNFVTGNRSLDATATTILDQVGVSFVVPHECDWITFGFRYQVLAGSSLLIVGQSGGANVVQQSEPDLSGGQWRTGQITVRRDQTSNGAALSFALGEIGAQVLIDEIWAVQGRVAVNPPEYGERIELLPAPIALVSRTGLVANEAFGPIDITNLPAALAPPLDDFATAPRGVIGAMLRVSMTVTGAGAGLMANAHSLAVDVLGAGPVIGNSFAWLHAVYGGLEHTQDIVVRGTQISGVTNNADALAYDYDVELVGWVLSG